MRQIVTSADAERAVQTLSVQFHDADAKGNGGAAPLEVKADQYTDRLIKYIPADVIALYITLKGVVESNPTVPHFWGWIIFGICLVAVPLWLGCQLHVTKYMQLAISTIAFVIWVLAMHGSPFERVPAYVGAIVLPIYTLFVAMIEPKV
jgi:hypothetical protein